MRVGIAGAGGIGSNVAVNLVRTGVTSLTIVDFDRVEASNLNRQFYFADQIGGLKVEMLRENLLRINPGADIEAVALRVNADNIKETFVDCDIIVEGFDGSADKKMVLESFTGAPRPVVMASGIAGEWLDAIARRRFGNCTIVGDFVSDCEQNKLYAHKVLAVACYMTERILEECGYYEKK